LSESFEICEVTLKLYYGFFPEEKVSWLTPICRYAMIRLLGVRDCSMAAVRLSSIKVKLWVLGS